uniref:Uncharacterized protein n=1 Tax=Chromera velia CCMP2878 TaxID=1169474 RepID=A0A0G4HWS2_9ALVE|eukprot:Cvel_9083.t1-p1 / transcript=Cvel_9083.t1 / gene=Cvel_9083 / organism=Chromera_velia_CCMP2878 / gene_product=hypothetical protein / transcript_product=hypothetical protein / location=Cvel_scaffold515:56753-62094(+) / protein_length=786 / sequence_SO=supercontig / SO=protein_coding / is_pseudo=false
MERLEVRDKSLFVILKRSGLSAENKESWNVSVDPPRLIDISDTLGLSAKKIFFFLEWLPDSVEEVKLGNLLGVPGFRALAAEIREGNAAFLRVLDLERTGSGGLKGEGFRDVWKTIKEKGLKVEELNLSGNAPPFELFHHDSWAEQAEIDAQSSLGELCDSVLSVSSLPCLRVLRLRACALSEFQMQQIVSRMVEEQLPNLETLDLGENDFPSLSGLASALRKNSTPHLRNLNLVKTNGGGWFASGITDFLSALRAEEGPSLEHVKINFGHLMNEEDLRALGGGLCPSVRTLGLHCPQAAKAVTFLRALVESSGKGEKEERFEVLDVTVHCLIGVGHDAEAECLCECLRLLGKGIQEGQLGFLRKVKIERRQDWRVPAVGASEGSFEEAKSVFFSALNAGQSLGLSELSLPSFHLSDEEMVLLGAAVQSGSLSRLRELSLPSNDDAGCFGREGIEALWKAVVGSEKGLPVLETVELTRTRADEGVKCLGSALLSGKLPNLSSLHLNSSYLNDEGVEGLTDAVRKGMFLNVTFLNFISNGEVTEGAWREFLHAIRQSERGLPKLKHLNLYGTTARDAGGPLAAALGCGKLPSLQNVGVGFEAFAPDEEGVGDLSELVRGGNFPPHIQMLSFRLRHGNRIDVDRLIRSIGESEIGLPPFLRVLTLSGARVGEEALASLAASAVGGCGGKFSQLEGLDLSDCSLDDNRLRLLGQVFSAHGGPRLNRLVLGRNRISIEGFKAFIHVLRPGCLPKLTDLFIAPQEGVVGEEGESALVIQAQKIVKRAKGKC